MNQLFAPWRIEWLEGDDHEADFDGCTFCALHEGNDTDHRVLVRGEYTYAVLNAAPYSPGHILIVPYEHTATYHQLDPDTLLECALLQQKTIEAVQENFHPHGMNIGMNLGEAGGASIPDHLHVHVVPRWQGDTTFMPVLADTKTIPEALDATYERLHETFASFDDTKLTGSEGAVRFSPEHL